MILKEGLPSLEYIKSKCELCECEHTVSISSLEKQVTPFYLIKQKVGKTEYEDLLKAERIKYKNMFIFTCPSCEKKFYLFNDDIIRLGCDEEGNKIPKFIYEGKKYTNV